MRLDALFSQPLSETFSPKAQESDWLDVGTVTVQSGRIAVGDTTLFPGDQAELEVDNGLYTIQAKVIDYGNDRRISRLRACRTASAFQTKRLGAISVDFARVGICDPVFFLSALETSTNGGKDLDLYNAVYSHPLDAIFGVITLDNHNMVFVQSGWGDGRYNVDELRLSDRLAGLEITFIHPDEPTVG